MVRCAKRVYSLKVSRIPLVSDETPPDVHEIICSCCVVNVKLLRQRVHAVPVRPRANERPIHTVNPNDVARCSARTAKDRVDVVAREHVETVR